MNRWLLLIIVCLPLNVMARQLTDLYFFPLAGEFVGKTEFTTYKEVLKGTYSGVDINLQTSEQLASQLIGVGILDWLTFSVEAPFSMGGDIDYRVGASTILSGKIDSESLGAAFNLSFLILDFEDMKNFKLGIDLHSLPKSFNDREMGFFGGTFRISGDFTDKTSWILSSSYLQYQDSKTTKPFSNQITRANIQHRFNDYFFLRPGILLAIQSKSDQKDESYEIHYSPRFGAELSFGGNIGAENVMWLATIKYNKGKIDYFETGAIIPGDVQNTSGTISLAYVF